MSEVTAALRHLAGLEIERLPLKSLRARMWELRDNVIAYVAIGERDGTDALAITSAQQ